jgi:hypothetical protein
MKDFVLLFRMDILTREVQPSKEQMELYMQQWMEWIDCIAEKGQLADGGNHLSRDGRILTGKDKVVNSPYVSEKSSVAGYIIIKAKDMDGAIKIAKRCPILEGDNTSVEIREASPAGE